MFIYEIVIIRLKISKGKTSISANAKMYGIVRWRGKWVFRSGPFSQLMYKVRERFSSRMYLRITDFLFSLLDNITNEDYQLRRFDPTTKERNFLFTFSTANNEVWERCRAKSLRFRFFYFISFEGDVSMGLEAFHRIAEKRKCLKKKGMKKNPMLLSKMYLDSIELWIVSRWEFVLWNSIKVFLFTVIAV